MLEDYHKLYAEHATINLPGWKKMNPNEICNLYVTCDDSNLDMKNGCIAALMCKYWSKITKYYLKCSYVATPEDCHDWLYDAISYTLRKHRWLDEDSSVYNDPNGPDKIINRAFECSRIIFYQGINRAKRVVNSDSISIENLQESYKDVFTPKTDSIMSDFSIDVNNYIEELFQTGRYLDAIILDGILNVDVIDEYKNELGLYTKFNHKRLVKHIHNLDDSYIDILVSLYSIDKSTLIDAVSYCKKLSSYILYSRINQLLNKLRATGRVI